MNVPQCYVICSVPVLFSVVVNKLLVREAQFVMLASVHRHPYKE